MAGGISRWDQVRNAGNEKYDVLFSPLSPPLYEPHPQAAKGIAEMGERAVVLVLKDCVSL
ncbi:hypothetical protein IMY05_003G0056400 [Salix suchowensis]|nr:hypothetical protein IMY05_003G0056400 [Salix suchowensis]